MGRGGRRKIYARYRDLFLVVSYVKRLGIYGVAHDEFGRELARVEGYEGKRAYMLALKALKDAVDQALGQEEE